MPDRNSIADKLISSYSRYYDIQSFLPEEHSGVPPELQARCDLHMQESSYVLLKQNKLWEAASHEYCYIFSTDVLTEAAYRRFESFVLSDGMERIHPKKGHKCTALTLLVLADSCEAKAEKALKHCHLHKNFKWSFWGWMDVRTALLTVSNGRTASNMSGHDNAKFLNRLIQ
jgi:hypothetical protein